MTSTGTNGAITKTKAPLSRFSASGNYWTVIRVLEGDCTPLIEATTG